MQQEKLKLRERGWPMVSYCFLLVAHPTIKVYRHVPMHSPNVSRHRQRQ